MPNRPDPTRGLRVLVLTNMYPTPAEPDFGCFVKDQVDDLRRLGVDATVLAFDGRSRKRRVHGGGTTASPGAAARPLRHRARPLRAVRRRRVPAIRDTGRDHIPRQRRLGAVAAQGVVAGRAADAADRGRTGDRRQPRRSRRAGHPVRRRPGCCLRRSTAPRPGAPWAGRRPGPACCFPRRAATARRSCEQAASTSSTR